MNEQTDSPDPRVLRLLPACNPNPHDRLRAWNELVDAGLWDQLRRFIQYHNRTAAADEDILQDTLLLAWAKVENGEYEYRSKPFTAYLKAIAGYKLLEAARERFHADVDDYAEALPDPSAELAPPEQFVADGPLRAALGALPPRRRDVLLLSELYEFSGEEIAARFHIRADLVRKDKSLALQQLRRTLAPELPDALSFAA
jgi:RNA polymerase sigma factor (sigma-70 family)